MALTSQKSVGKSGGAASLLALDFATSGIKAVRLKRNKDRIELVAADLLPAVNPDDGKRPVLDKDLLSHYAALCATMDDARIRVFSKALTGDEPIEALVRDNLGAGEEFRVAGRVITPPSKSRKESLLLGVAVPEKTVLGCLEMFAEGAPALRSFEVSGLSALSAFLFNCAERTADQTVCVVDAGARTVHAAFFHRNEMQMINRFESGGQALCREVQAELGLDAETTQSILAGGTVNVSSAMRKTFNAFIRQLAICREFVERQNKSSLSAVYVSGGLSVLPGFKTLLRETLGIIPEVWNPFSGIELPNGLPDAVENKESRFASAVGAALAGMEEA